MNMKLNRGGYVRLCDEDMQWLLAQPRSLERDHIEIIIRDSVQHYYPEPPSASAPDAGQPRLPEPVELNDPSVTIKWDSPQNAAPSIGLLPDYLKAELGGARPTKAELAKFADVLRNQTPSAPASAARESHQALADALRQRFNDPKHRQALRAEDKAYQDGTTAIFDTLWLEVAETVTEAAAEQTRQLRSELATARNNWNYFDELWRNESRRAQAAEASLAPTQELLQQKSRHVAQLWKDLESLQQELTQSREEMACGHPFSMQYVNTAKGITVPGPSPTCALCDLKAAEAERDEGRDLLKSVSTAMTSNLSLVEFYAKREMASPSNGEEAVRETREQLREYRKAEETLRAELERLRKEAK